MKRPGLTDADRDNIEYMGVDSSNPDDPTECKRCGTVSEDIKTVRVNTERYDLCERCAGIVYRRSVRRTVAGWRVHGRRTTPGSKP